MADGATQASPARPAPTEIIEVEDRRVACDGGVGALGHPRIFMTIPENDVMCPYCSRLYVLKPGAGNDHGH